MGLGEDLRALAELVEDLDSQGIDVVDATRADSDDEALVADLRIRVPHADRQPVTAPGIESTITRPGIEPQVAEATNGTELPRDEPQPDTAATAQPDDRPHHVDRTDQDADSDSTQTASDATGHDTAEGADGRVPCTHEACSETFDTEHGMRIHRSKTHVHGGADRDPAELARVYERHDYFPAMRDALDADVSPQTVRRWMMDAGIHDTDDRGDDTDATDTTDSATAAPSSDPCTTNTPEAETSELDTTQQVDDEPDGFPHVREGLPDTVAVADLRAAVESASTLYDVQQQLDVDRETAREILAEYDLLELVHGRIADRHRREELKDEIDDRLRANTRQADSPSD